MQMTTKWSVTYVICHMIYHDVWYDFNMICCSFFHPCGSLRDSHNIYAHARIFYGIPIIPILTHISILYWQHNLECQTALLPATISKAGIVCLQHVCLPVNKLESCSRDMSSSVDHHVGGCKYLGGVSLLVLMSRQHLVVVIVLQLL